MSKNLNQFPQAGKNFADNADLNRVLPFELPKVLKELLYLILITKYFFYFLWRISESNR